jgi:ABC-type amino acid transport substrate-binding protein
MAMQREDSVTKKQLTYQAVGAAVMAALAIGFSSWPTHASGPNDLLAQVQRTHTITIAESAFAPEDFQNPVTKQWTGYDINILRGFATSLHAHLQITAMPFASSIQAVADRRDDLTIDIYWNPQRAKVIGYSRPMLNYNDAVAVNSLHPTVTKDTIQALRGKKIAVVTGSAEVQEADKIPGAQVVSYDNVADSFLALSNGSVDADLQPNVDVAWSKHQNPSLHIKILGAVPAAIAPPIASLRGYYGVPKGPWGRRFLAKLNAYLKRIECDGQEQKILDHYGMQSRVFLAGICQAPNTYSGK